VRVSGTPMGKFNPLAFDGKLFIAERGAVIIDPQTGEALASQGYDIGISAGCQWGFALASGYLLSGPIFQKVEGTDFTDGFTPWAYRTGCNAATFPAFGMMYCPSGGFHSHNFLNGVSAWFDADESRKATVPDEQQLVRGPAWPAAVEIHPGRRRVGDRQQGLGNPRDNGGYGQAVDLPERYCGSGVHFLMLTSAKIKQLNWKTRPS